MKNLSYNYFWQRIHRTARNKGFPLRVMFELTYQCNFYCKHCYVPKSYRKRGELRMKEVFLVLDELKDMGCFYLGFTGGEPFVRKDILDILWYAKRKGFEIIIYTNGSLIDEALADELAALRPNKVDITIPGMSNTSFERISGVAGSRNKVFKAIDWLYKRKVSLGFKTCVLKENEAEIKDIQEFASSLGALHRLDDLLSPRLNGSVEPYRHRGRITEDRRQITGKETSRDCFTPPSAGFAMTGEESPRNDVNLFKCGVGVSQAAITPLGELKPCLMIDSPRFRILRENRAQSVDFKAAWGQLKKFVSAIKPDKNYKCRRCNLQAYCKWCPARGWLYNKTFTSCEPESRKMQEIQYKTFSLKTHKKNWRLKSPNVCQFELTFKCGLHCKHCYTDCYNRPGFARDELSTKEIKFILDKIHHAGVIWLCFTGGDPLTRKDFLEIYAYAKNKGFIVTVFTNAYSMTEEIADYLKKSPPFVIEITLNAVTKGLYEKISQVKGSFEKAMAGIKLITQRRLPIKIKTQVIKDNFNELGEIKEFVESLGLDYMPSVFLQARLDGNLIPSSLRISAQEVLSLNGKKGAIKDDCGLLSPALAPKPANNLFQCAIGGGDGVHIDPYGNLFPCICIREPKINLLKESVEQAQNKILTWIRSKTFTINSKCEDCSIRNDCRVCPGKALLETGSLEKPVEWFCELAKVHQ